MNHHLITQAGRLSFVTFLHRILPLLIFDYQHFSYVDLLGAYMEDLVLHRSAGRLAINLPPRHGKSFIIVALAAWHLGLYPAKEVLLLVHSHSLAADLGGKLKHLLDSKVFSETFPAFGFQPGREAMTDFRTSAGGGFKAAGLDSNVTGRGADLLLIDDVLPAQDTTSANARAFVRDTYDAAIATRLNNQEAGKIISMSHRLHEQDLTGHLLSLNFEHLKLPFVATEDEVYSRCGVIFKRLVGEVLQPGRLSVETTKRSVSSYVFATQYQQAPTAVGFGRLKREQFPTVQSAPTGGRMVMSWDTAASQNEGSSYSVGLLFQALENASYLRQIVRGRYNYTQLRERALHLHQIFKPIHLVEATSVGVALIEDLRKDGANVIEIRTGNQSKEQRLDAVMNKIEDRFIQPVAGIPELEDYLDELTSFPNGTYNDCVDATTQFLNWVRESAPTRKHPCITLGAGKTRGLYRNGLYPRDSRQFRR